MPRGWRGAPEFPSASATRGMRAGLLLTQAVPVPGEEKFPLTNRIITWNCCAAPVGSARSAELPPIRLQIPGERARMPRNPAATRRFARPMHGAARSRRALPTARQSAGRPERFASLADRLISECGADVIFFGTPEEKEIVAQNSLEDEVARDFSGRRDFHARSRGAVFRCSVFIGNDSGAMHVAAAAGIPVIGIFGSTDPEGTAPVTQQFSLIREPVSCSPCFLRRCPVDHRCMTRISVDSVFQGRGASGSGEIENPSARGAVRMSESQTPAKRRVSGPRRHDLRGNGIRQSHRPLQIFPYRGCGYPPVEPARKFR